MSRMGRDEGKAQIGSQRGCGNSVRNLNSGVYFYSVENWRGGVSQGDID